VKIPLSMPPDLSERRVEPELLETYPIDHPDAVRGRADLRLVNAVMGNHRWIARTLRRVCRPGWRVTEIGAGDGALSRRLASEGICATRDLHAFDLAPPPPDWPATAGWTQGDLMCQPLPDSEVLVANLFLHHLEDEALRELGRRLPASVRILVAAEPARRRLHSFSGRLLCQVARLHPITRHDMQTSIRAGFRAGEMPARLGLGAGWQLRQQAETWLGGCRLLAVRAD
jgi:hypothetical protein